MPAAYIYDIATAVPDQSYSQEFILEFMKNLTDDERQKSFLEKIYRGSAIEKRHTVIEDYHREPEDYRFYPKSADLLPEPSTARRNDYYIEAIEPLVRKVLEKLFRSFEASRITHLVTVSCTGFSAPGIGLFIQKEFGLSLTLQQCHIGFMGCCAAFPALRQARDIVSGEPEANVLVLCAELCSLHFQQRNDLDIMVANALFADGVAAAIVGSAESFDLGNSPRNSILGLHRFQTNLIPDSKDDMAWRIGDCGFDMKLSAYVPRLIGSNIAGILQNIVAGFVGNARVFPEGSPDSSDPSASISHWAIHPGGRAILEKLSKVLELPAGPEKALRHSYEILRQFGNMSSATILFVLERFLRREYKETPGLLFAAGFGPGLTVESALMELY
ncbi:type III polyketide synthase [Candidatus Haliotispira prima]|uniref:Type III polyketide synthase n=1 Tax=Candidatus Haliotispira prima TaxID=3034016 RepID=A0ABY8MK16_9SPIO|nr:type III polyketide synthase [Candidatus Haliotispira prima]